MQEYVNLIRPHVDVVVVLAHQGVPAEQGTEDREVVVERDFEEDVYIINEVSGIDVLIAGHCHKSIEEPYVAKKTGTLLVSTRGLGTVAGCLQLTIDAEAKKIVKYTGRLEPIYSDELEPDPAVADRLAYWDEKLKVLIDQPIGEAVSEFTRNYFEESALGNLITDAVRDYTKADMAFQVGGGLRADIAQGTMTYGDIMNVLPFNSEIHVMDMSGVHLLELLEQSAAMRSGVLQQSGLVLTFDPSKEIGQRVVSAVVNGQPVQQEQSYTIAVNAFIVSGGDGFTGFLKGTNVRNISMIEREIVVDYIKRLQTIEPKLDGRIMIQSTQH